MRKFFRCKNWIERKGSNWLNLISSIKCSTAKVPGWVRSFAASSLLSITWEEETRITRKQIAREKFKVNQKRARHQGNFLNTNPLTSSCELNFGQWRQAVVNTNKPLVRYYISTNFCSTSESLCEAQTELPKPFFSLFSSLLHVLRTVHFVLNFGWFEVADSKNRSYRFSPTGTGLSESKLRHV